MCSRFCSGNSEFALQPTAKRAVTQFEPQFLEAIRQITWNQADVRARNKRLDPFELQVGALEPIPKRHRRGHLPPQSPPGRVPRTLARHDLG